MDVVVHYLPIWSAGASEDAWFIRVSFWHAFGTTSLYFIDVLDGQGSKRTRFWHHCAAFYLYFGWVALGRAYLEIVTGATDCLVLVAWPKLLGPAFGGPSSRKTISLFSLSICMWMRSPLYSPGYSNDPGNIETESSSE